jgi:hypothetical protein
MAAIAQPRDFSDRCSTQGRGQAHFRIGPAVASHSVDAGKPSAARTARSLSTDPVLPRATLEVLTKACYTPRRNCTWRSRHDSQSATRCLSGALSLLWREVRAGVQWAGRRRASYGGPFLYFEEGPPGQHLVAATGRSRWHGDETSRLGGATGSEAGVRGLTQGEGFCARWWLYGRRARAIGQRSSPGSAARTWSAAAHEQRARRVVMCRRGGRALRCACVMGRSGPLRPSRRRGCFWGGRGQHGRTMGEPITEGRCGVVVVVVGGQGRAGGRAIVVVLVVVVLLLRGECASSSSAAPSQRPLCRSGPCHATSWTWSRCWVAGARRSLAQQAQQASRAIRAGSSPRPAGRCCRRRTRARASPVPVPGSSSRRRAAHAS